MVSKDMDNLTTEVDMDNQIMEETTINQITIILTIKVVKNQVVIVLKLVVLAVQLLLVVVVFVICSTDDCLNKLQNIKLFLLIFRYLQFRNCTNAIFGLQFENNSNGYLNIKSIKFHIIMLQYDYKLFLVNLAHSIWIRSKSLSKSTSKVNYWAKAKPVSFTKCRKE